MPQPKRGVQKTTGGLTFHQWLLVVSAVGIASVISTYFSDWPYELAKSLGRSGSRGVDNAYLILRIPALLLFFFLALYSVRMCISEYQKSFDTHSEDKRGPKPGAARQSRR